MSACDVVTWVGGPRCRHGHWLPWICWIPIVWTEGELTGSQIEKEFGFLVPRLMSAFTALLNSYPGEHVHLWITSVLRPYGFFFLFFFSLNKCKKELALSLSLSLSLSPSLAHSHSSLLKLGSCWASEKGGDFLLDKHVINRREHILSHRKITKGEMSGVVT